MDWLPLTLLCAFSVASADAVTKKTLTGYSVRELVLVRFGATALVCLPILALQTWPVLPMPFWAGLALLLPLEILAMGFYMLAIRDHPLSLTLPYLAFTPVFTTLTGFLILGEQVSLQGFLGILLVVAGAYLLNRPYAPKEPQGRWWAPFAAMMEERGSRLMLSVAGLYSLTSVIGKGMLKYTEPSFFGPFYFVVLGFATLVVFSLQSPSSIRVLWRRPGWHLALGLIMAVMVVTHFLAMSKVEVAYMIAVKRTSLLFGMVYGALLFQERQLVQRLMAGSIMVAGVFLVAS